MTISKTKALPVAPAASSLAPAVSKASSFPAPSRATTFTGEIKSPIKKSVTVAKKIRFSASGKTANKEVAASASHARTPAPIKTVKITNPVKTVKVSKAEKPIKPKLVRDSFTIPKTEYLVIEALKLRAAKLTRSMKKSELLRAGIKALAVMSDAAFLTALEKVPAIKTGRPPQIK